MRTLAIKRLDQMVMRKLALLVDGIRTELVLAIAFIITVMWVCALTFMLFRTVPTPLVAHPAAPSSSEAGGR